MILFASSIITMSSKISLCGNCVCMRMALPGSGSLTGLWWLMVSYIPFVVPVRIKHHQRSAVLVTAEDPGAQYAAQRGIGIYYEFRNGILTDAVSGVLAPPPMLSFKREKKSSLHELTAATRLLLKVLEQRRGILRWKAY